VALVGTRGSSKSTLAKLVYGLYEPWQGEILFDEMPRAQVPRLVLTQTITTVPGEFIALVGPFGSGKLAIVRLLLGLETPEAGRGPS
jgi:ABC-type bacteriocin/lantibiotic exporter with double-glycine peptidase domain